MLNEDIPVRAREQLADRRRIAAADAELLDERRRGLGGQARLVVDQLERDIVRLLLAEGRQTEVLRGRGGEEAWLAVRAVDVEEHAQALRPI